MHKPMIKVAFEKRTPAEKVLFGERVAAGLTNNPLIPNAEVYPQEVSTATADFYVKQSRAESSRSRQDYAAARAAEVVLYSAINRTALYVQSLADADPGAAERIILSSGFDLRKQPEKHPAPPPVSEINAEFTGQAGTILVQWKNARYSRYNDVMMSTTPADESSWVLVDSVQGRKLLVQNLVSGTRYYFKVVARNYAGKSQPSEIADQLAA